MCNVLCFFHKYYHNRAVFTTYAEIFVCYSPKKKVRARTHLRTNTHINKCRKTKTQFHRVCTKFNVYSKKIENAVNIMYVTASLSDLYAYIV